MSIETLSSRSSPEPILSLEEEIDATLEVTRFGQIAIASATCGERLDNVGILSRVLHNATSQGVNDPNELEDITLRAREKMESTGFTVRYVTREPDQAEERSAQIGARLIRAAMEEKGWESIDHLVHTSSVLSTDVGRRSLRLAGLDEPSITDTPYRAACAGAVTAFVDSLADPDLQDKRIVICALEPLTKAFLPDQYNLDELNIATMFGDDYAAIAFRPSDWQLRAAETFVKPDGGTIRLATDYEFPNRTESFLPEHVLFAEEAEEMVSISEDGVYINTPKPLGDMPSEMNAIRTTKFFIRNTPGVLKRVLENADVDLDPDQVIMHQPSAQVNLGIQRAVDKMELGINLPQFRLGSIERSNSGSATTLVVWQSLAKHGLVNPDKPFIICAPGIGSITTAAVVNPK